MNILLITDLAPKWAGNQSITRTLNGMAEAGHTVHMVSIRSPVEHSPAYDLHPNVHIHYYLMMPSWLRAMWVPVRKAMSWLERAMARRRGRASSAEDGSKEEVLPLIGINGYSPAGPETRTSRFTSILGWLLFQLVGFFHGVPMLLRRKIDLVYGYEVYGAPVAFVLAKLFRKPIATRFQGTYLYPVLDRPRWWLDLHTLEHLLALRLPSDLVIMANDGTRGDEVLRRIGVPDRRVISLTNGVDFDAAQSSAEPQSLKAEVGLDPDSFLLLTVSKLAYWKRVDRAIRAMPRIIGELPNVTLVVVGDGPQRALLEGLANQLGVSEHVRITGQVQHSEVKKYLRVADVFMSLYELSNRGNPLLEAMVHGRCILTVDDGSVGDLIVEGETGTLLDVEQIEERLPDRILGLLNDAELRRRLGEGARQMAHERLMTVEQRMRVEVEALERLAANSGSR